MIGVRDQFLGQTGRIIISYNLLQDLKPGKIMIYIDL